MKFCAPVLAVNLGDGVTDEMNERALLEFVTRTVAATKRRPDGMAVSAFWTDSQDWEAGVHAGSAEITVYYGPASKVVDSQTEAAELLKGIFADEVVCVTALEKETPILHALARHDDPTAAFTHLDQPGAPNMPAIDHVMVRSWTGKRDRE